MPVPAAADAAPSPASSPSSDDSQPLMAHYHPPPPPEPEPPSASASQSPSHLSPAEQLAQQRRIAASNIKQARQRFYNGPSITSSRTFWAAPKDDLMRRRSAKYADARSELHPVHKYPRIKPEPSLPMQEIPTASTRPAPPRQPAERPGDIKEAPTFYPTLQEFADPMRYIRFIASPEGGNAAAAGICKIVPPQGWNMSFVLDQQRFRFTTRVQRLSELSADVRTGQHYVQQLHKFHTTRLQRDFTIPILRGEGLDLYRLKVLVQNGGGFDEVSRNRQWTDITRKLGYPKSVSNPLSQQVKISYRKIIAPYEQWREKVREGQVPSPLEQAPSQPETSGSKQKWESSLPEPGKRPPKSSKRPRAGAGAGAGAGAAATGSAPARTKTLDLEHIFCMQCGSGEDAEHMLLCDECDRGFHLSCLTPKVDSVPQGEWYCDDCLAVLKEDFGFDEGDTHSLYSFYRRSEDFRRHWWTQHQDSIADYQTTSPAAPIPGLGKSPTEHDVEQEFWRLTTSKKETVEVEYGADIDAVVHGSPAPTLESHPTDPDALNPWNLNNFPVLDGSLLRYLQSGVAGMTSPFVYVGMLFSTFCWHMEDHFSYSINYQHFGHTKTWYGVPASDAGKFQAAVQRYAPDLFEGNPDILYQLVTLFSPALLKEEGVKVCALDQRAGEFVVTFPKAFHAGFNQGFNLNEAVNFVLPDWIPRGKECIQTYREIVRQPAFSHDQLLWAASVFGLTLDASYWLAPPLKATVQHELFWRQRVRHFSQEGMTVEEPNVAVEYEETRQCALCKCYTFFTSVELAESDPLYAEAQAATQGQKHGLTSCLEHAPWVFGLTVGKKFPAPSTVALANWEYWSYPRLPALYTLNPVRGQRHLILRQLYPDKILKNQLAAVQARAKISMDWVDNYRSVLEANPAPELEDLRAMWQKARGLPAHIPEVEQLSRFLREVDRWRARVAGLLDADLDPRIFLPGQKKVHTLATVESLINAGAELAVATNEIADLKDLASQGQDLAAELKKFIDVVWGTEPSSLDHLEARTVIREGAKSLLLKVAKLKLALPGAARIAAYLSHTWKDEDAKGVSPELAQILKGGLDDIPPEDSSGESEAEQTSPKIKTETPSAPTHAQASASAEASAPAGPPTPAAPVLPSETTPMIAPSPSQSSESWDAKANALLQAPMVSLEQLRALMSVQSLSFDLRTRVEARLSEVSAIDKEIARLTESETMDRTVVLERAAFGQQQIDEKSLLDLRLGWGARLKQARILLARAKEAGVTSPSIFGLDGALAGSEEWLAAAMRSLTAQLVPSPLFAAKEGSSTTLKRFADRVLLALQHDAPETSSVLTAHCPLCIDPDPVLVDWKSGMLCRVCKTPFHADCALQGILGDGQGQPGKGFTCEVCDKAQLRRVLAGRKAVTMQSLVELDALASQRFGLDVSPPHALRALKSKDATRMLALPPSEVFLVRHCSIRAYHFGARALGLSTALRGPANEEGRMQLKHIKHVLREALILPVILHDRAPLPVAESLASCILGDHLASPVDRPSHNQSPPMLRLPPSGPSGPPQSAAVPAQPPVPSPRKGVRPKAHKAHLVFAEESHDSRGICICHRQGTGETASCMVCRGTYHFSCVRIKSSRDFADGGFVCPLCYVRNGKEYPFAQVVVRPDPNQASVRRTGLTGLQVHIPATLRSATEPVLVALDPATVSPSAIMLCLSHFYPAQGTPEQRSELVLDEDLPHLPRLGARKRPASPGVPRDMMEKRARTSISGPTPLPPMPPMAMPGPMPMMPPMMRNGMEELVARGVPEAMAIKHRIYFDGVDLISRRADGRLYLGARVQIDLLNDPDGTKFIEAAMAGAPVANAPAPLPHGPGHAPKPPPMVSVGPSSLPPPLPGPAGSPRAGVPTPLLHPAPMLGPSPVPRPGSTGPGPVPVQGRLTPTPSGPVYYGPMYPMPTQPPYVDGFPPFPRPPSAARDPHPGPFFPPRS